VSADNRDIHSFAEPWRVRVEHCALNLEVDFDRRQLRGTAELRVERPDPCAPLILDTRDLVIEDVRCGEVSVSYELGDRDPILGGRLVIQLEAGTNVVTVQYETQPHASGLQWLNPEQTAGKEHPFLFSQSQSIHARSWIPIQDSPGVRVTYDARIKILPALKAVMSAERVGVEDGWHVFKMALPIPPYLIALAVGDVDYVALGPRTGIYAEKSVLAAAASEFEDTEKLVEAVERLYGPYRWGRYELLVLPPSFPFGGMENPVVTFATPTVIAGDKSLVGLVSHELAHSWSGNLVTNATWSDFWLNEGFTTYIENRIQEEVYGLEQALMEQVLDRREIEKELREFEPRDQVLHIDLSGRDPDEGCTRVPYIKGALLLRQMEQVFGRNVFDGFLRSYFDHFKFRSIATAEALDYLRRELFDGYPAEAKNIPLEQWVFEPGLPDSAPRSRSERLEEVSALAHKWGAGEIAAGEITASTWNTQQWLEFLQVLPPKLAKSKMAELDEAFHLTGTGNFEILDEWLVRAIESQYEPAYDRLEQLLFTVGRMKLIRPLYSELMKTPGGEANARELYKRARPMYHPIAQTAIDKIVYFSSKKLPANSASIPEE
jgi:leukotriene-A4 hydrolase